MQYTFDLKNMPVKCSSYKWRVTKNGELQKMESYEKVKLGKKVESYGLPRPLFITLLLFSNWRVNGSANSPFILSHRATGIGNSRVVFSHNKCRVAGITNTLANDI